MLCAQKNDLHVRLEGNEAEYVRASESKASASYMSSMHLSRVLSPVISMLTPSRSALRESDLSRGGVAPDAVGDMGVEGTLEFFRADAWQDRRVQYGQYGTG